MTMFDIRKRIVYLRRKNELSQHELADFLNISRSVLAKVETGLRKLDEELIDNLSKIFRVPKDYLTQSASAKKQPLLEKIFDDFLIGNTESMFQAFSENHCVVDLEDEIAFKLLETAFHNSFGDYETADKLNKDFLELFLPTFSSFQIPDNLLKYYHIFLHEQYRRAHQFRKCQDQCRELLDIVTSNWQKGCLHLWLSIRFYESKDLGKAYLEYLKTEKYLINIANPFLISQLLMLKSAVYSDLKLYQEAEQAQNDLLKIATEQGLSDYIAVAYQHKGHHQQHLGNFHAARIQYEHAFLNVENLTRKSELYLSLVRISIRLLDYDKGITYMHHARKEILSRHHQMILLSYEAEILLYKGEFKKQKPLLKTILAYFRDQESNNDLKYIYTYLANFYYDRNPLESAYYFKLREAL